MDLPDLGMVLNQLAEAVEPLLYLRVQLLPIIEDSQHTIEPRLFGEVRHHHDAAAKFPDAKFQWIILPIRQICNLLGDGVSASDIQAVCGCFLGSLDEVNQSSRSLSPASRSKLARLNELRIRTSFLSVDDTTTSMKSLMSMSKEGLWRRFGVIMMETFTASDGSELI
jgi:hypothetical protein